MSDMMLSLDNYISDEYSICREERQYALFLYNILKKHRTQEEIVDKRVKHIMKVCELSDVTIVNVYYEATFMRDFFERSRRLEEMKYRNSENIKNADYESAALSHNYKIHFNGKEIPTDNSFNQKLLGFLLGEENDKRDISVPEKNLGHDENARNSLLSSGIDSKLLNEAKYMMNSKPDIAVVYEKKGGRYLLFLECKFESGEDTLEGAVSKNQTQIQYKIAKFICANYGVYEKDGEIRKMEISDKMSEASIKVSFDRRKNAKDKIFIKDLIDLNECIFDSGVLNENSD